MPRLDRALTHVELPMDQQPSRLRVSDFTKRLELGEGFAVISHRTVDGEDSAPVGYIASATDAVAICHAVNNHDALLAACKALLAAADHTLPADWRCDRPVSLAKAAIARAEAR